MATCHRSYLFISSKHVLCCPDLGAVVIYSGLTSDIIPSKPAKCLNTGSRRTEATSFPSVSAEDGSSRNQTWHLLHTALGPRAVSCSSMEQTGLLLRRRVCGEQQTLGREGSRHCHTFLIIKHQEPWVKAGARSWGVLICTLPSTGPADFRFLFLLLSLHIRTESSGCQY